MADPEPRDSAGRNRGFWGNRVDVSGRLCLKLGLAVHLSITEFSIEIRVLDSDYHYSVIQLVIDIEVVVVL